MGLLVCKRKVCKSSSTYSFRWNSRFYQKQWTWYNAGNFNRILFARFGKLETILLSYTNVVKSSAYTSYGLNNKLLLTADIVIVREIDIKALKSYLEESCDKSLQSVKFIINGREVAEETVSKTEQRSRIQLLKCFKIGKEKNK